MSLFGFLKRPEPANAPDRVQAGLAFLKSGVGVRYSYQPNISIDASEPQGPLTGLRHKSGHKDEVSTRGVRHAYFFEPPLGNFENVSIVLAVFIDLIKDIPTTTLNFDTSPNPNDKNDVCIRGIMLDFTMADKEAGYHAVALLNKKLWPMPGAVPVQHPVVS